jgi:hypothetical protein
MAAGLPAIMPPCIRRNFRRNCREIAGKLPGKCPAVSGHRAGQSPGSFRHGTGGQPPASPPQLPGNCSEHFRLMAGLDPNLLRQAAAEFQPRRQPRFQNLQPCREVILELRGKSASCEAIAELLTKYGVKTSRTMVTEFVRSIGQAKGGGRRKPRLNRLTPPVANPMAQPLVDPVRTVPSISAPAESAPLKTRGPHIAKVELLKPGEQYE